MKSIIPAVLLGAFACLCGCKSHDPNADGRITVDVCADGACFINGRAVEKDELRQVLKNHADRVMKEVVNRATVSTLEVLIRTAFNVRYEDVNEILGHCGWVGIRKTFFSSGEVAAGKEIKLWLPCYRHPRIEAEVMVEKPIILLDDEIEITSDPPQPSDVPETNPQEDDEAPEPEEEDSHGSLGAVSCPCITLCDFRIKLFWVDRDDLTRTLSPGGDPDGSKGMVALKVKDQYLMKGGRPDWKEFSKMLKRVLSSFTPTECYNSLPVIIDARQKVHFADVLRCVLVVQKAGLEHIILAVPPEVPY